MSADNRALIARLLKVLKVMQSAHEHQVHMGIWEADISAIEDAIVALSSTSSAERDGFGNRLCQKCRLPHSEMAACPEGLET
jgi:hypothetical protein